MATTIRRDATEEDLRRSPDDGNKRELVDGAIRVSPVGFQHGHLSGNVLMLLKAHVKQHRLGYVVDSSTGFRLPGGNVRLPDVAFVAVGRFPDERMPEGFSDAPPDLAVEVLSPDDRVREVLDKIGEYLQAGVRLVWVIDPRQRAAVVYRSAGDVRTLHSEDTLDGEDVVPGFRCRLLDALD